MKTLPSVTMIDIRPEGAFVVPAPKKKKMSDTVIFQPDEKLLRECGATPTITLRIAHSTSLAAFFDAAIQEGIPQEAIHKILGIAFENLKKRAPTVYGD